MPSKADKSESGARVKRVRKQTVKKRATKVKAKSKAVPVADIAEMPDEEVIDAPRVTARSKSKAHRVTAIREKTGFKQSFFSFSHVRKHDITVFLRQLVMLLSAGTPLLKSLRTLANRLEGQSIRAMVRDITEQVENGNPLWQAFERHPHAYFDTVFVAMIKASEASGTLVDTLRRQTEYFERREMLKKRIQGALVYPVVLTAMCFAVLIVLAKYIIPEFENVFEQLLKGGVPVTTQRIFDTIRFLVSWNMAGIIGILIVLYILYLGWIRNPANKLSADRIKLRIPLIGRISQKYAIVQMNSSLALLLKSGLSMMITLDLTRNAIHNLAVAQVLQHIRSTVEQGGGIEAPLRSEPKVIPPVVADMLVTGEESGQLDQIAEHIAKTYEEEVELDINTLTEMLPVFMVLLMGIMVVVIVIGIFVPLISGIQEMSAG